MNRARGFTLIELLMVIAVIGILAAVILASLDKSRTKALNSRRLQEIQSIHKALIAFHSQYGCLPVTNGSTCISGYNESDAGGWDYSSQGGFLTFLVSSGITPVVPVDPKNDMEGASTPGKYAYRYYCYTNGNGVQLGYWTENPRAYVAYINNDGTFTCR